MWLKVNNEFKHEEAVSTELLIITLTLIILVLLLSTIFYLQPREFIMAFALVPGAIDSAN